MQVDGICNPYQVVVTVVYEVAHHLIYRSGHVEECNNAHCASLTNVTDIQWQDLW